MREAYTTQLNANHPTQITKGEKTMPTKFPIDYEPGKVQGFLISKETGQMIEATPLTEIIPKPWPIDDIETETEPQPPKSLTFSGTFTLKTKMNANQRRKLIKALSGKQKLPRKLKKALKHVGFFQLPMERVETQKGVAFKQTVGFGPKDGYPCTKWVNCACLKLKAQALMLIQRELNN